MIPVFSLHRYKLPLNPKGLFPQNNGTFQAIYYILSCSVQAIGVAESIIGFTFAESV